MRVCHWLLGLVVLAACSACSKPDIYLCGSESGQVTVQESACPLPPDVALLDEDYQPKKPSDVRLLTRLPLPTLPTLTSQAAVWMNWAYTDERDALYVKTTQGQTGIFGSGGNHLYAIDLSSGKELWRHTSSTWVTSALINKDRVFAVSASDRRITAYDRATGKVIAVHKQAHTATDLLVTDNLLVFVDNYQHVVALDSSTLTERWRITPPSYELYTLQLFDNTLVLTDRSYTVHAYALDSGEQRWQRSLSDGQLVVGAQVFFHDRLGSQILTLDVNTGATVATYRYDENASITLEPFGPLVLDNTEIDTGIRTKAFDPLTGAELWTSEDVGPTGIVGPQVSGATLLAIDNDAQTMRILDLKTGTLLATLHIPRMHFSSSRSEQNTTIYGYATMLIIPRKSGR